MEIKIKKLCDNAVIPAYAHDTDAGLDLVATSKTLDEYGNVVYGTGLAFEIPQGYVGLVFPRSSNSKKDLILTNSVGVIDSGYRGEVTLKFKASHRIKYVPKAKYSIWKISENKYHKVEPKDIGNYYDSELKWMHYNVGDRIGQMIIMPYPKIEFVEAEELSETERGTGGYGSTGK